MVANNPTRTGPNGRRYADYMAADTQHLAQARAGLDLREFELTPEQRAGRVEAYRQQVETAGRIVQWLPPPADGHRKSKHRRAPVRFGRQRRWFELGRLDGSCWSPAFVSGG